MVRLVDVTKGDESSPSVYEVADDTTLDMQQVEAMMPLLSPYSNSVTDDGYFPL